MTKADAEPRPVALFPGSRRGSGRTRQPATILRDWPDCPLPALVQAQMPGLDLSAWLAGRRDEMSELCRASGAILFRSFAVEDPADFGSVMRAMSDDVLTYSERSSPRSEIADRIYTSTDHPADQPIVVHNEQSYTLSWPLRIVFYCDRPPSRGGRTPLADSRRLLAMLRPQTVAKFDRLGILYVRNYLPGIGLTWQDAFQTENRTKVGEFCRAARIEAEWVSDSHLRTRQIRPAVRTHPVSGERTWFNHALFFHVTSLPGEVQAGLRASLTDDELPANTYYGDGSPMESDVLAELRDCYQHLTVAFNWRRGDVLQVENMLVAHGRESYEGTRRILTAMADGFTAGEEGT
jgi:alpha-ketoglutarate-dependent taurine dioxygenase